MRQIARWFLQGLVAILPIAVTLAILYWLGSTAESSLGAVLQWALPEGWYFPGLGLLAGIVVITATGVLANAYLFRKLLELANGTMSRIPLVSTLFDSIRDIAKFADPQSMRSEMQRPVLVSIGENMSVIGFVTNKSRQWRDGFSAVPVYVPMSYQLGGFTLLLPEDEIQPLDMEVPEAMRWVISAGMVHRDKKSDS
jgi:uncharacterized membrane protein